VNVHLVMKRSGLRGAHAALSFLLGQAFRAPVDPVSRFRHPTHASFAVPGPPLSELFTNRLISERSPLSPKWLVFSDHTVGESRQGFVNAAQRQGWQGFGRPRQARTFSVATRMRVRRHVSVRLSTDQTFGRMNR
jgi:hypothetical protein